MRANTKAAVDVYVKMERNLAKLQGTILDLLAHPHATDEQCLAAAKSYRSLVASVDDTRAKVLEQCRKVPRGALLFDPAEAVRSAFKERRKACR